MEEQNKSKYKQNTVIVCIGGGTIISKVVGQAMRIVDLLTELVPASGLYTGLSSLHPLEVTKFLPSLGLS